MCVLLTAVVFLMLLHALKYYTIKLSAPVPMLCWWQFLIPWHSHGKEGVCE